jgi:DNA-binding transcriptional LysR family regulator
MGLPPSRCPKKLGDFSREDPAKILKSLIFIISNSNILTMNPQINLLHLKFFCDVALYKSFSDAARLNFVSQSAVSQGISKLERMLGAELFMPSKQKLSLTEEGQIVFEQARHVFRSIHHIYDGLNNQHREEITGTLKFVTTKSLGGAFIPKAYERASTLYPKIDLRMNLGGLGYICNLVKEHEVDFGIVVYDENFAQFAKHPIKRGKFNLYQGVSGSGDRLFRDHVLVNYFKGTYVHDLSLFLEQCSTLRVKTELSGWEVLARFTELNLGIGFFPDYIVANNRYPTIKPYPLELPAFDYEICAIYNRGEKLSRTARTFIDLFSQEN